MTPERKKKLRQVLTTNPQHTHHPHHHPNPYQLLMREAAKQLKIEQEKKEAERRKVIGNYGSSRPFKAQLKMSEGGRGVLAIL